MLGFGIGAARALQECAKPSTAHNNGFSNEAASTLRVYVLGGYKLASE